jgi:hypothetical protein
MTTIYKDKTECPNCNDEVEYTDLMSTNSMGYPDLDLRPPPMQRDTLHTYIKVCHSCGCRFAKIYPKELFKDEIIKSPEYLKILDDAKKPSLAKDFLAYAFICTMGKDFKEAYEFQLYAAWVCDDHNLELEAIECRKQAYLSIKKSQSYPNGFVNNETRGVVLVDILRRAKEFNECQELIQHLDKIIQGSKVENEDVMLKVLKYQFELAEKNESKCYTLEVILS